MFGLIFLGDRLTVADPCRHRHRHRRRSADVIQARRARCRAALSRRCSGSSPARCSRCRRSAIAAPSCLSACQISWWRRRSRWPCGLVLQAALLTLYLALRDRAVLAAIARAWRPSLFAGFMGATASQFWFLAFALTSVGQRAHVGAGRSAVRAGHLVFRIQAGDHRARSVRHVADRRPAWRC